MWSSPRGDLDLVRWPPREDDPLQAWDGADRYLIEELDARGIDEPALVVGDAFGTLGTALGGAVWGDSELSRLALGENLARNGRAPVPWTPITEQAPRAAAVVGRLPRSGRRLQWMLQRLAPLLAQGTPVIFGAKSKRVQRSAVAAMEAAIGPASSTLARHRARLVVAVRDGRVGPQLGPSRWEAAGVMVAALPGVFGDERLDGGTALMVPAVPMGIAGTIVDLGCGSGVLGLVAARRSPLAAVVFRDASHCAVASARLGFVASGLSNEARFEVADVLEGIADRSVALVLCNPPFHQGHAVSRRVAAHMIKEAARVLRPGGALLLVGNRHLGYHAAARGLLAQTQVVASDRRFVVIEGRAAD